MYTMIAIGIMYIGILIVYLLSSIGISDKKVSENSKSLITFTFVPVNTIILLPILIKSFNKRKDKKISAKELNKRTIIMVIVAIVVLVCEFFYFRNIQNGIVEILNEKQNAQNSVISEK